MLFGLLAIFLIFLIISCSRISSRRLQEVGGINTQSSDKFLTKDVDLGYEIQYPSDWEFRSDSGEFIDARFKKSERLTKEVLLNGSKSYARINLIISNYTLTEKKEEILKLLREGNVPIQQENLSKDNLKYELISDTHKGGWSGTTNWKAKYLLVQSENILYQFSYVADEADFYNKFEGVFEEVISSFRLIKPKNDE